MPVFLFLLLSLSGTPLKDISFKQFFVVWNVGQGQWITAVSHDQCLHFDMGGEYFPFKKILKNCKKKKNKIFFSHSDWDHISALKVIVPQRLFPNLCIAVFPYLLNSKSKHVLFNALPCCSSQIDSNDVKIFESQSKVTSNDSSHVFGYQNFLIPGDSTIKQEVLWKDLSWVRKAKFLVLGHHGSKTSTSEDLLNALPHLRAAVSSARWARYRHPSAQVQQLLKKHKIPLLKTEDWGNLWFNLK